MTNKKNGRKSESTGRNQQSKKETNIWKEEEEEEVEEEKIFLFFFSSRALQDSNPSKAKGTEPRQEQKPKTTGTARLQPDWN